MSGRVAGGEFDADALQLGGEVLQDVADGAGVQLVEVVDGVPGLVGGLGADDPEFVGLPDEVDVLGEPQVVAAPVGLDDRRLQERGDAAQLVEDGAAGGFGGVRGEDGTDVEVLDRLADVLGVAVLEHVDGAGEEAALGGALLAHLAAAVDLLGDVREVEVRGEGAYQLGGGLEFDAAQQLGGGFAVLAGEAADPLDEVEEFVALLADECLAEEIAQSADVGAQLGAGGGGLVGTAHRCGSLQCLSTSGGFWRLADRAVRRTQDRCPHCGRRAGPSCAPCRAPRRCHTYDAVGYGSVASCSFHTVPLSFILIPSSPWDTYDHQP